MEEEQTKKGTGMGALQGFVVGVVVILVLVAFGVIIYGVNSVKNVSTSPFTLKVAKALNLSAAEINGLKVSYLDYIDDLETLKKFYGEQSDLPQPSDQDISDQVISRLLANTLIANISKDYDVEVTDEDVEGMKQQLLSNFPDEAAAEAELMSRYGWTLEKYLKKVVRPLILEQKLQEKFTETAVDESDETTEEQVKASHILFKFDPNTSNEDTKTAANEVLKQIKEGADFAEMATKYGSDGTKDVGGDLGWFGRGVMVPEFEEAVFALEPGQLADQLVETQFGYHIIKLEDRKYTRDFVTFMDDKIKNAKIEILINIHNPFESLLDTDIVDTENIENVDSAEVVTDIEDVEVTDDTAGGGEGELVQ